MRLWAASIIGNSPATFTSPLTIAPTKIYYRLLSICEPFVVREHSGQALLRRLQYLQEYLPVAPHLSLRTPPMSKQRRTADDFVRDMKAKQQRSTPGDIDRKTSEG